MARARNIKPAIMANEQLAELPALTRLLFIYLWMLADREGRLEDRPKRIAVQALPYDRAADAEEMLEALCANNFIARYVAAGKKVIQIVNFYRHQTPHGTEKDGELPDEEGLFSVHARGKNGYATGGISFQNESGVVIKQSPNQTLTVKEHPDSRFLIPDSLIPEEGAIAPVGKADLPACRTQEIVDMYHTVLPELPRVKVMSDGRRKAIAKFWRWVMTSTKTDGTRRAETGEQTLSWICTYFERARENDFLMGRGSKAPGHEGWRCDLDFLLTDRGIKQVIEKTGGAA